MNNSQTAKYLFDRLLEEWKIDTNKFYRLFAALGKAPYIQKDSIRLATGNQSAIRMEATYTGQEQIGKSRKGPRSIYPQSIKTTRELYDDISRRSGTGFFMVYPDLDNEECYGFADIGLKKENRFCCCS